MNLWNIKKGSRWLSCFRNTRSNLKNRLSINKLLRMIFLRNHSFQRKKNKKKGQTLSQNLSRLENRPCNEVIDWVFKLLLIIHHQRALRLQMKTFALLIITLDLLLEGKKKELLSQTELQRRVIKICTWCIKTDMLRTIVIRIFNSKKKPLRRRWGATAYNRLIAGIQLKDLRLRRNSLEMKRHLNSKTRLFRRNWRRKKVIVMMIKKLTQ
jgi:hypothetical protein